MNQTLLKRARCMLSNDGLEKKFWVEAEGFNKQAELHEIQSDYPELIDP